MNSKTTTMLSLVVMLASFLFAADGMAQGRISRLAQQVSMDTEQVFRTADRQARRFNQRETRALRDLRDLSDTARRFESDARFSTRQTLKRSFDSLDRAVRTARLGLMDLTARAYIASQFRTIEQNVSSIGQELRGGGGGGQQGNRRARKLARQYNQELDRVLQGAREVLRRRIDRHDRPCRPHREVCGPGRGRGQHRQAMQSLRDLKMVADKMLQRLRNGAPGTRILQRVRDAHRSARQLTMPLIRGTYVGQDFRTATQSLRQLAQVINRGGHGGGNGGGWLNDDDFGFQPPFDDGGFGNGGNGRH